MYHNRLVFALAMAGLAAIFVPSILHAQIIFERTYGGMNYDEASSVQQTTDGGYVVAGYTASFGAGGYDVYLIKTDAYGETLWTRTFGGDSDDYGSSVRQTFDGGYVVAGCTRSFGAGGVDIYLLKTDASGDTLWTRTFGGADNEYGYAVQQTSDGGYVIAGADSFPPGYTCVYLVKTDANGDTLWTRTFGETGDNYGYSVQQTSDGGYIIAGLTWIDDSTMANVLLVKTDANGYTLWTRTFCGTGCEQGNSVQQTTDGGFVIAGHTSSFGAGDYDVYLIKTDSAGDTLWTRTFGGADDDYGYSVQQTSDGGYIIAGGTYSFGAGAANVYLIRTDTSGDTLWTQTFGRDSADFAYEVRQTTDCGYIVAGRFTCFRAGSANVYLIKTDSLGTKVAVAEPKASPTRAPALALSCEPNPFRARTAISLRLAADSPAALAIFEASGRRVRTFTVNREPYTVWDGKDDSGRALPSGAYFVRVDAGNKHATTRVVLQR